MRKLNILLALILVIAFTFTSCNKDKTELPKLETQADSLNYAFGLANGKIINDFYLKSYKVNPDTFKIKVALLLEGLDKATIETEEGKEIADNKDEIFQLGLQFGNSFKQQMTDGLLGETSIAFNQLLVRQGLINALYDFEEGMNKFDAEPYLTKTMKAIQEEKSGQQVSQPAVTTDTIIAN